MDSKKLNIYRWACLLSSAFVLNCFSSEKTLPEITGAGQITGKVVGPDGIALGGVQITTSYNGNSYQTTSVSTGAGSVGTFKLAISDVERGSGLQLQFTKYNFENASAAAVISNPSLQVDVGNVTMYVVGGTEVKTRKIQGQIIDNFSYKPLKDASITATDSAGQVLVVTTDASGKFSVESSYFALGSSFALIAYKSNYIPRTDIVAVVTAEENTIKNNPFRLYNKFGSIYGYLTAYDVTNTLGPLNGATAALTTSNNQNISCVSGGPYNSEPLGANQFCPDMDDNFGTNAAGAGGGGFKIKDSFLLLGNRYPVTLSYTSAACTNRTAGTSNCYRTKTQYADVLLTGNNAISGGGTIELQWDAWITGNIVVMDRAAGTALENHTVCTAAWNVDTTCAGAGVTVKLYDASNKYITQTVTDASGNYRLESNQIIHHQTYKMTYEINNAYSRIIGYSNGGFNSRLGTRTSGSNVITAIADVSDLVVGTGVSGYGIPGGATITSIGVGTINISAAATANSTSTFNITPAPATRTGTRTNGSNTITGLGTTVGLKIGMSVSGAGMPATAYIAAILTATSIQIGPVGVTALSSGTSALNFANVYQVPLELNITNTGDNNIGTHNLTALPPPSHCVRGTVTDYWSMAPIENATVGVFDGGWRVANTNNLGQFTVNGVFTNNAVDAYPVQISKTGYTGESDVNVQRFNFTHNTTLVACPGSAFDLDNAGVGACNATGTGPTGGTNCANRLVLHPIGVYSSVGSFASQIKQTYEKFLTEKNGLTISARTSALPLQANPPAASESVHAFYLHFDDTPRVLPGVPEGRWSNHVPINPTSSSPTVNGVLTEGLMGDSRITPWEIKTYTYYHFYAAALGSYTIQTTGSTDTYMTIIAQTGANLGSNDDGGSGSNASMTVNLLPGWYYVKISSKNDNIFGFFDVNVTGPTQAETGYISMLSPISPSYQANGGTASYATNCGTNNGNLVMSWYRAVTGNHMMFIAAPGEHGGCNATSTIEMHGEIGNIIRGKFSGTLRPIAPGGSNQAVTNGYFNIIRME